MAPLASSNIEATVAFCLLSWAFTFLLPLYPYLLKLFLALGYRRAPSPGSGDVRTQNLAIVICTFNEAAMIEEKLKNTLALPYSGRMRVLVVDGGSTDATRDIVGSFLARNGSPDNAKLYLSPSPGKIPQLNFALSQLALDEELVLITDADSLILSKDALNRAASWLGQDSSVGVVGGYTDLPDSLALVRAERLFWKMQNKLRTLESDLVASNLALAPFMMFRRTLFGSFPANCLADDVYVSFCSHAIRKQVLYLPEIRVVERRFPISWADAFRQKQRKIEAYSKELLRFLPRYQKMFPGAALGCLFRLCFFFVWPLSFLAVILFSAGWYAAFGVPFRLLLAAGVGILLFSLLVSFRSKTDTDSFRRVLDLLSLAILLVGVLLVNLAVLPFSRKDSRYSRVSGVGELPAGAAG